MTPSTPCDSISSKKRIIGSCRQLSEKKRTARWCSSAYSRIPLRISSRNASSHPNQATAIVPTLSCPAAEGGTSVKVSTRRTPRDGTRTSIPVSTRISIARRIVIREAP